MNLSLPANVFQYGILAAVSGGADSTALLHFLADRCPPDGKIAAAHVNHGLRGTQSDEDAAFVRQLAEEYRFPYFEHTLVQHDPPNVSENALRKLRYQFLLQKAEEAGCRFLATAHTADDQTETVLLRIMRGTGLEGVAGIPPLRQVSDAVTILRPMLHLRRSAILEYLNERQKPYRHDESNDDCRFTRNRLRNLLLPVLREEFNPKIDEAVCRLATLAGEHEAVLSELFEHVMESVIVRQTENEVILRREVLRHFSLPAQREIFVRIWKKQDFPLLEMDYQQWTRLAELPFAEGALTFPGKITAECTGEHLRLYR